jgi:hypothetical protein
LVQKPSSNPGKIDPMKTRKLTNAPRATWREHFLAVAREAGEPLSSPARAGLGLRPRGRPGLSTFARRRLPMAAAAAA